MMDRGERIPVHPPEDTPRIEDGRLLNGGTAAGVGLDFELEPGSAGEAHLRTESQQPPAFQGFDAPAIHRVTRCKPLRITASTAEPCPAEHTVQQPTHAPEPVTEVPANPASDPLDRLK